MSKEHTPKLCECGCGGLAPISPSTHLARGYVRGEPRRFITGHNGGREGAHRPFTPWHDRYVVEDRGYETPCWIWQMSRARKNYGRMWYPPAGRVIQASRAFYQHFVGPIAEGLQIDHLCRVHECVNPAHLEPVTQETNLRRGKNAKLSDSDRDAIALLRAQGVGIGTIAQRFNVSKPTIKRALLYEGRSDRRK